jgi:hypothetical protein
LFRRTYKTLPVFSSYLIWSLFSDLLGYLLIRQFQGVGLRIYLASAILDSVFMFCVLIEVSMSVLKPLRSWLPVWMIGAIALLIALAGGLSWQFVSFPGFPGDYQTIGHLQLTVSAVRVLFFLVLAGFSQLLSIGWRDRELQIATGFGFYAIASLFVAILQLHMNQAAGTPELKEQYNLLETIVASSYLCSLVYWCVCFAQKAPERREFTPQMQKFLLAVAGNARGTRIAMASSASESKRDRHVEP